ncbi:hypothetical protein ACNVED_13375 [Legionella sp. D16C41]|uniref:hypothetical protein n=1 Tax=Legionella sp. D16C41 TaxID=3402688 RepID=UPI003AF65180
MPFSSSLTEDLAKYNMKKSRSIDNNDVDKVKHDFFKQIKDLLDKDGLTVDSLTNELENLVTQITEWNKLFYQGWSDEASSKSHAAQLVRCLYAELGVFFSDKDFDSLICERKLKIPEKNSPFSANLSTELDTYLEEKQAKLKKKQSDVDTVKYDFFKQIQKLRNKRELTVARLTEELHKNIDVKSQRDKLFYRGLPWGSSNNSHAAQLIRSLYAELGVSFTDAGFDSLIYKGELRNADETVPFYYELWSQNKFLPIRTARFERELKGYLVLPEPTRDVSLAEALYEEANKHSSNVNPDNKEEKSINQYISFEEALFSRHLNFKDFLTVKLTSILEKTPNYLPFLIDKLYKEHISKASSEVKKKWLQALAEIAAEDSRLCTLIIDVNIECAIDLINIHPKLFFDMSQSMQQAVLTRLRKELSKENESSIDYALILIKVNPKFFSMYLSESMQTKVQNYLIADQSIEFEKTKNEISKLINNGSLAANSIEGNSDASETDRQELEWLKIYNGNPNTETKAAKERLAQIIFDRLWNRKSHGLSNIREATKSDREKEAETITKQAKRLIQDYLNLAPNSYKTEFFENLWKRISDEGFTLEILQNELDKKDKKQLFKTYISMHSRSQELIESLYTLVSKKPLQPEQRDELAEKGLLPILPEVEPSPADEEYLDPAQSNVRREIKSYIASDRARETAVIKKTISNKAMNLIKNYLDSDPSSYKANFFKKLQVRIVKEGFTLAILQQELNNTDKKQLFKTYISKSSHSKDLIVNLYELISGKQLTDLERETLTNDGKLPTLPEVESPSDENYLKDKLHHLLNHPEEAKYSKVGRAFEKEFHHLQSIYRLDQHERVYSQNRAEALYQAYIIAKGIKSAKEKSQLQPLIFDPQGHVLITTELKIQELHEILNEIIKPASAQFNNEQEYLNALAQILGNPVTKKTFCSLDIMNDSDLKKAFYAKLDIKDEAREQEPDPGSKNERVSLAKFYKQEELVGSRNSIIPLQEELSMHLNLCFNTLQKKAKGHEIRLEDYEYVLSEVIAKINTRVLEAFKTAYENTKPPYKLNSPDGNDEFFSNLNKRLDKERLNLAQEARALLAEKLKSRLKLFDKLNAFQKALESLTDHDFTSTPATECDYLHTDIQNETVARINATGHTAHDKKTGPANQALRLINRNHLSSAENGDTPIVTPYFSFTQEARVPSLAVFSEERTTAINDVKSKLRHGYQLLTAKNPQINGPIIYNLLTSLYTEAYDKTIESNNKQRQSAEYILLGAHGFNREQILAGRPEQLVYVQNIPVNQHTRKLDYHDSDDVTAEAALMTDLSLLTTFNQYSALFPLEVAMEISEFCESAQASYVRFLSKNKEGYFKDSIEGKNLIKQLDNKKAFWAMFVKLQPADLSMESLALHTLFKLMISNDYHDPQFGMLAQTLSVFLEPISEAGCKSANERYQGVSGRVDILKSTSEKKELNLDQQALQNSLRAYASSQATASDVQKHLDIVYNKYNLYGVAKSLGFEDQGAAAKVKAARNRFFDKGYIFDPFDTNVAETAYLTRLQQGCAGDMQSHKAKLAEKFRSLFASEELASRPIFN